MSDLHNGVHKRQMMTTVRQFQQQQDMQTSFRNEKQKKDNLRRDLQEQVISNILKRERDRIYPGDKELTISKRLISEMGVDMSGNQNLVGTPLFG